MKKCLCPTLLISRGGGGGQEKCVLYSTMKKLPNQFRIFLGKIFIFGGIHSVWGKICVEKILSYNSGANLLWNFLVGGNLKSLFFGQILFIGGFFLVRSILCMGNLNYLYFGVKFFLFKGNFKQY